MKNLEQVVNELVKLLQELPPTTKVITVGEDDQEVTEIYAEDCDGQIQVVIF